MSSTVALQGHALFVRQAGGVLPCPQVDFTGGFNGFLGAAYGLGDSTVEEVFGAAFGMLALPPILYMHSMYVPLSEEP